MESLLCCLTRHEGLSQSHNLTSVWSRLLCLCAPAPLPRTSSFLHSIDLKSEHSLSLYQKLATFILAKHHIQQAEEASSWCHLDNHLAVTRHGAAAAGGGGEGLPLGAQWSGAKFNVRLDCVWRVGRLATRVSSHQSIPAILSHTHFKQQLSSEMSAESLVIELSFMVILYL